MRSLGTRRWVGSEVAKNPAPPPPSLMHAQSGSLLFPPLQPSSFNMRKALSAIVLATLLLPACSTPHASGTGGGLAPFAFGDPYVRILDANSNLVELQIAVRKFEPAHRKRPSVW